MPPRRSPLSWRASADPVARGLVTSLAKPGGNVTGLSAVSPDLSGKRLELLKETVPGLSRVGVFWDENAPGPKIGLKEYEGPARALKIRLQSLEVRGPNPALEGVFQAAAKERVNALITLTNPLLTRYAKQIAELAIKNQLPSMYERAEYVNAGGLVSYSTNDLEPYRRAATSWTGF